jgi:DnaJ-class molecular chaperone
VTIQPPFLVRLRLRHVGTSPDGAAALAHGTHRCVTCSICKGHGFTWKPVHNIPKRDKGEKRCMSCSGTGVRFHDQCTSCRGKGVVDAKGSPAFGGFASRKDRCLRCRGTGKI